LFWLLVFIRAAQIIAESHNNLCDGACVGGVLQEDQHDVALAVVSSHVQSAQSVLAGDVDVGAAPVLQQQPSDVRATVLGGHVQRSEPGLHTHTVGGVA